LLEALRGKQNTFFLLQFTALSWSPRGFALPAVGILKLLKKTGAVVFHDPDGYAGNRAVDHFRKAIQRYAMKRLVRLSDLAIFTLPRDKISWLPAGRQNFIFIPVGANLPKPERAWEEKHSSTGSKPIVAVFSLSDKPTLAKEVSQIAQAVSNAVKQVGPLEVVVLGRNSESGGEELRLALAGSGTEVRIVGLIPADEVVHVLGASGCDVVCSWADFEATRKRHRRHSVRIASHCRSRIGTRAADHRSRSGLGAGRIGA
jgi:hypothetical protein